MPDSHPLYPDQDRVDTFVNTLNAFGTGLAVAVQRLSAAVRPVAVAAHAFFDRPDVQARFGRALQHICETHDRIQAVDAPGYTPYFERLGRNGLEARLHAGMIRGLAKRRYEDDTSRRTALATLHDLARRPRWHPALAKQVARLGQHGGDLAFLDEVLERAGCAELKSELLGLLLAARNGDCTGGPRVLAIVAGIAPHLPSSRGRRVRFETVLHRTFLDWSSHFGGRQAYTYGPVPGGVKSKEDFTDPATTATRIELRRPRFNPVAARRSTRDRRAAVKS